MWMKLGTENCFVGRRIARGKLIPIEAVMIDKISLFLFAFFSVRGLDHFQPKFRMKVEYGKRLARVWYAVKDTQVSKYRPKGIIQDRTMGKRPKMPFGIHGPTLGAFDYWWSAASDGIFGKPP